MAKRSKAPKTYDYPDDIFADTRMTFGEHIEELRMRMIRALIGLVICLFAGFVLDGIGAALDNPNIGIGRPMISIITDPVETQVRDFYNRRNNMVEERIHSVDDIPSEELAEIEEQLRKNGGNISELSESQKRKLMALTQPMWMELRVADLAGVFGPPRDGAPSTVITQVRVRPAELSVLANRGDVIAGGRQYLTTLSAQEAFVVYFKVSLLCGAIISSPWILYQFWMFVGAGLYPHEKRYVYIFFWPSVILFTGGAILCQFIVMPGALKALLKFNEFLGFDPDIRLNEWLSLAIILPLVFGLSFQTPLVMIFLNRIGVFSAEDYASKWRYACMILAIFAAIITPTPDVVTMGYLFLPMFGLYLAGIVICHFFPGFEEDEEEEADEEVAV